MIVPRRDLSLVACIVRATVEVVVVVVVEKERRCSCSLWGTLAVPATAYFRAPSGIPAQSSFRVQLSGTPWRAPQTFLHRQYMMGSCIYTLQTIDYRLVLGPFRYVL